MEIFLINGITMFYSFDNTKVSRYITSNVSLIPNDVMKTQMATLKLEDSNTFILVLD